ncbi:hypothetical protein ABW19_dt0206933 [Dactylella cylindrospora]|nr:hypothetical protein ABW19_dt0206933 [Dactylella cylindrospora]
MKFITSTVILFLAATLANCAPAPEPATEKEFKIPVPVTTVYQTTSPVATDAVAPPEKRDLEKRVLGGVFFCDFPYWGTPCNKLFLSNGECRSFAPGWITMGSVGPDSGTWCILYGGHGCTDQKTGAFTTPGRPENYYSSAKYVGSIHCWW